MNIIDEPKFKKFLQELVFELSEISDSIKAVIIQISHSFFSTISAKYFKGWCELETDEQFHKFEDGM